MNVLWQKCILCWTIVVFPTADHSVIFNLGKTRELLQKMSHLDLPKHIWYRISHDFALLDVFQCLAVVLAHWSMLQRIYSGGPSQLNLLNSCWCQMDTEVCHSCILRWAQLHVQRSRVQLQQQQCAFQAKCQVIIQLNKQNKWTQWTAVRV